VIVPYPEYHDEDCFLVAVEGGGPTMLEVKLEVAL